jgi:Asp/Glu/hydantoin racemase
MGCRQFSQWEHAIQHRTQCPLVDGASQIGCTTLAALQRLFSGARPERDAKKPQPVITPPE